MTTTTTTAQQQKRAAFDFQSKSSNMDFFSPRYDGSNENTPTPVPVHHHSSRRHSYAHGEILPSEVEKKTRRDAVDGSTRRARASVEFLLCEILDDIVNLPMDDESSDEEELISPVSQISETPSELSPAPRKGNFRRWRNRAVLWGATVGVICSAVLR
ncbi:hypothetical protein BSKO_13261 [Bryopsis sp. KO-2023]|nr:hypothetical protein BSKO_13261 [Bryopsis sp. KO-2023]